MFDGDSRGLGNVAAEGWREAGGVISVDVGVCASAGNGDVGEAVIDELAVGAVGVDVDKDACGSEALRTVRGNGVAVVEVSVFCGVELDVAAGIEFDGKFLAVDASDVAQFAIGDLVFFERSGELNAFVDGELFEFGAVDGCAVESLGVVSNC